MTNWKNRIVGTGEERPDELLANPYNHRLHPDEQQRALRGALNEVGWVQQVLVNETTGHVVDGHLRVQLAQQHGESTIPVTYLRLDPDEERKVLAALDATTELATIDEDKLREVLDGLEFDDPDLEGFIESLRPEEEDSEHAQARATLAERFLVPPFTVLDARGGEWQERKRAWRDLGVHGEAGRDAPCMPDLDPERYSRGGHLADTSVFDPVLAELIPHWFAPVRGHILDPWAGEATKGIVAAYCGFDYTGVELRQEQIEANEAQAAAVGVTPEWVQGDSEELDAALPEGTRYDLVWSSPPYYDLEIYSQDEKDGSAFETYDRFIDWYARILEQAVGRLHDNRFVVLKVGDVRDERGAYRDFVSDTSRVLRDLGLHLYNEAILVTPAGSLPVRAAEPFRKSRKLGKAHQNVLAFYKGDDPQAEIERHFGAVEGIFDRHRQLTAAHEKVLTYWKGDPAAVKEHVDHDGIGVGYTDEA